MLKLILILVLNLLPFFVIVASSYDCNADTLLLVNVIFRHGDRTPTGTYPKDPYQNASIYHPYRLGDLTRVGQARAIEMGLKLRVRYQHFLDADCLNLDTIQSLTSEYRRTEMSLQAVHAGLFYTQHDHPIEHFPWQAVPFSIIIGHTDTLIAPQLSCPTIDSNLELPHVTDLQTLKLFKYIAKHAGYANVTYKECEWVMDVAKTQKHFGLELPDWLAAIYPSPLDRLAVKYFYYSQKQYKRYGGGGLVKRITEEALAKANGTLVPSDRKLVLYSGHDVTINFLLGAIGCWVDELVDFSAYVLIELHRVAGVVGFRVYYDNQYREGPKLLTVPGCDAFCPLDRFIELTEGMYNPPPVCI